jgi:hypothetical protein
MQPPDHPTNAPTLRENLFRRTDRYARQWTRAVLEVVELAHDHMHEGHGAAAGYMLGALLADASDRGLACFAGVPAPPIPPGVLAPITDELQWHPATLTERYVRKARRLAEAAYCYAESGQVATAGCLLAHVHQAIQTALSEAPTAPTVLHAGVTAPGVETTDPITQPQGEVWVTFDEAA